LSPYHFAIIFIFFHRHHHRSRHSEPHFKEMLFFFLLAEFSIFRNDSSTKVIRTLLTFLKFYDKFLSRSYHSFNYTTKTNSIHSHFPLPTQNLFIFFSPPSHTRKFLLYELQSILLWNKFNAHSITD
jgi:hypothetical protein